MKPLALLFISTVFGVLTGVPVSAQEARNGALAADLVKRLDGKAATYFAASVPDSDSRFVAALHIPNVQLLVITADYPAPALLKELLLKGDYQRVYRDLNSAAPRDGRFFVEDLGADGIRPARQENSAFDITWRDGSERTVYDGNWKAQKLSEEEYRQRFARDAEDYAQAIQALIDAHIARSSTTRR